MKSRKKLLIFCGFALDSLKKYLLRFRIKKSCQIFDYLFFINLILFAALESRKELDIHLQTNSTSKELQWHWNAVVLFCNTSNCCSNSKQKEFTICTPLHRNGQLIERWRICLWIGRSEVQILIRSNWAQCCQRHASMVTYLRKEQRCPRRKPVTCLPVCHKQWRLHTFPFIAERQAWKLLIASVAWFDRDSNPRLSFQ